MEIVFEKGSLSELITGKKVENKEKVVIRYEKLESEKNIHTETSIDRENDVQPRIDGIDKPSSNATKKPKKRKKVKVMHTSETEENVSTEIVNNLESVNKNVSSEEITLQDKKKVDRKEKKAKAKKFKALLEEKEELNNNPEELAKTLFVGNVPLTTTKIKLKRFFNKYGKVESVRFRCPPVKNINSSKKVTVIKGEYHPERNSWVSYVKFQTEEDAKKGLEANGEIYKDHHLRVSICTKMSEKYDESRAIFTGNLPLNIEDDQLWKAFESCGKIESVRIVRDRSTGMGKGFAYINFTSSDSVQLALEMEDVKINKKVIRIQPCNTKAAKKNKMNSSSKVIKSRKPRNTVHENNNKRKREDGESVEVEIKKKKTANAANTDQLFAGTKVLNKKKKKKDKGVQKKLKLAKKLVS